VRDPGFREYSRDEIDVALAALAVSGDYKKAAKFADVPVGLLRRWHKRAIQRPDQIWVPGERPYPPEELLDEDAPPFLFEPAPEVVTWIRQTFLDELSPVHNPEHLHLECAKLAVLWTNCPNSRLGKGIAGTAERLGGGQGGKWQKARALLQFYEWFGHLPDFLITLDAANADSLDDASFMALVEHEMYHCAQALDEERLPSFDEDGLPKFRLVGHDFEGFHGVTRRYGIGAAEAGVVKLIEVARNAPEIARAEIAGVCGTCLRMVS
jgi:hypothetical protein